MKRKKSKRKFNIIDMLLSILFSLILSIYVLPLGINYMLNTRGVISYYTKQNILIAGKNYLDNNKNIDYVSISELIKSGYLEGNKELDEKNCFSLISTVNKSNSNNKKYFLDLKCIDDKSILVLSK